MITKSLLKEHETKILKEFEEKGLPESYIKQEIYSKLINRIRLTQKVCIDYCDAYVNINEFMKKGLKGYCVAFCSIDTDGLYVSCLYCDEKELSEIEKRVIKNGCDIVKAFHSSKDDFWQIDYDLSKSLYQLIYRKAGR